MTNCTGKRCPVQVGKVDPAICEAYKDCQWATRPVTNADRIRAMTDDKLAGYINYLCDCGFRCPCFEKCNEEDATSDDIYTDNYIPCTKKIYDWLKQEVEE